ncbi:DNA polymerase III beta clamp [Caulobacter phage Sansa]|uniref:DNA polymerase III beta clamp n=1 Tax=Caulobacter phage Sansa TaxID=1675600 RepID=A0A0K1LLX6_9CAUD|nr:DNA polymerase processivity factor [Caulobacter phage Sansa]AKU43506.1 DNA polymerase III beta clamp [Caulobacter phage Sansa]
MTLTPTNARIAPTAVITAAGALAAYEFAVTTGAPEAYQAAADQLADVVRRGGHKPKPKTSSEAAPKPAKRKAEKPVEAQAGIFNAQNMYAAVQRVTRVLETRSIPILQYVRIRVAEGRMMISGTDLDMEIVEVLFDCDAPEMDVCVPGKLLLSALQGARGGIALDLGVNRLNLSFGGVQHNLTVLDAGDYPSTPKLKPVASFNMPVHELREKLKFVVDGISTEETRFYLNGVWIHLTTGADGIQLTMVSTDGHRLFRDCTLAPPITGDRAMVQDGVIIPRKGVNWLLRNMPKTGNVSMVYSKPSEAYDDPKAGIRITFEFDQTMMITKVIDGSYPDYGRVIPGDRDKRIIVRLEDTAAAAEVVTRVASVNKEKSRAGHFSLSQERVSVKVKSHEGGEAEAYIPAAGAAGTGVDIGINVTYFLDAVTKAKRAEMIVGAENEPVRVDFPDHPGRTAVLMPLRL